MSQPVLEQKVKAFSYIRFSTPQQALGDTLKRQSEKAAKYAAEHGLKQEPGGGNYGSERRHRGADAAYLQKLSDAGRRRAEA